MFYEVDVIIHCRAELILGHSKVDLTYLLWMMETNLNSEIEKLKFG